MNKSKVIETLREAAESNVTHGEYYLYDADNDSFCAVGYLAFKAGVTKEDLLYISTENKNKNRGIAKNFIGRLWKTYRISYKDRSRLEYLNDNWSESWEDLIELIQDK